MADPVTLTMQALDRAAQPAEAEAGLGSRLEHFLLRTGRPLPRVIVLGTRPGLISRLVDQHGGNALGIACGPRTLEAAQAEYPRGRLVEGDFRRVEMEANAFDGALLEETLGWVPKSQIALALAGVHRALRPGGLISAVIEVGDGEGWQGERWLSLWREAELAAALGVLDFSLLESAGLAGNLRELILRREY